MRHSHEAHENSVHFPTAGQECSSHGYAHMLTAALATAKAASLETALTSPSDLMMRFTRARGNTCVPAGELEKNLTDQQDHIFAQLTKPEESFSVSFSAACCGGGPRSGC